MAQALPSFLLPRKKCFQNIRQGFTHLCIHIIFNCELGCTLKNLKFINFCSIDSSVVIRFVYAGGKKSIFCTPTINFFFTIGDWSPHVILLWICL
jgi:hypothetical protein